MKNDTFTVLVSRGGRHHWVSMCTVWLSKSKWLSEYSNESASNFALNLNIPPWKLCGWFRRLQLWATGDWQLCHNNTPTHASRLMQSFLAKHQNTGDSVPLKFRFGALNFWLFKKLIHLWKGRDWDCQWDSGKYNGAADGDHENCVRSQRAYFKGDWGVIVFCTMFLISCIFFSKCLYFS